MTNDKKALLTQALDYAFLAGEIKQQPSPVPEFHLAPGDRRRFDWAWPVQMLLVEVHGATWSGGRHVRGRGFEADRKKARDAVLAGWRVLEYTVSELERDPIGCAKEVARALEMPK